MRFPAWLVGVVAVLGALGACVGDDTSRIDAGSDAANDSTIDSPTKDATGNDGGGTDAGPDVDQGPPIDGGFAFAGHWQTFSNSGNGAESIAAIPTGGFVISGSYTTGSALIGAYPLPVPSGSRDAYVATLDAAGKVTAAVGFGGAGADNALTVTADANGDVYVAGISFNGLTLNGQALSAGTFLAKLNGKNIKAAPLWAEAFALTAPCATCLVTQGGDLVLATSFGGFGPTTVDFGGGAMTTSGGFDIALVKLDASSGNFVWQGQIGGAKDDTSNGLAIDAARNIYFLGVYQSATLQSGQALGSKAPTGPGTTYNLLVAKLDSSATPVPQWAKAYGDPGGTSVGGYGIAVDGTGHVAVCGAFNGGVDFGKGATGSSNTDGIVFVLDGATQQTIWQQVIGDVGGDRAAGVAFDAWGHVVVTGVYEDSPLIGSTHLADAGASNLGAFIAKYGPPPTYGAEWGVGFPQLASSTASITSVAITVAPSGIVAIAGGYGGTADFGAGNMAAISTSGTSDTFVAGRLP